MMSEGDTKSALPYEPYITRYGTSAFAPTPVELNETEDDDPFTIWNIRGLEEQRVEKTIKPLDDEENSKKSSSCVSLLSTVDFFGVFVFD